jgi:hypothetical protein
MDWMIRLEQAHHGGPALEYTQFRASKGSCLITTHEYLPERYCHRAN